MPPSVIQNLINNSVGAACLQQFEQFTIQCCVLNYLHQRVVHVCWYSCSPVRYIVVASDKLNDTCKMH